MTIYLVYNTVALSETGRSIAEVLVGESIFLYVWCGNGVPTPLFLAIHGHCKVRSLNHRVKCDYSVQRLVTSTSNLTASKHVTIRC